MLNRSGSREEPCGTPAQILELKNPFETFVLNFE